MRDDEDERGAPRFKIMHFTLVMLALLFLTKVTEVATGARELLSVREASAADEKADAAAPAAAAPADSAAAPADASATPDAKDAAKDAAAAAPTADAKAEGDAKKDEAPKDEKKDDKKDDKKPKEEMTLGTGKHSIKDIEALKDKDPGTAYSPSELDLLQNLAKRREELDEREKELDLKAKVLDATELRITNKVNDMKLLQADLSKVVAQYNQQQDGEIKSLVKIYENMKPLDAAAIFNEMDMPILLEVIDKMSERKVAPVLAGMNPKRARDVTQELAEMRRGRAGLGADAAAAAKAPTP